MNGMIYKMFLNLYKINTLNLINTLRIIYFSNKQHCQLISILSYLLSKKINQY
jgi:hypothetical protein